MSSTSNLPDQHAPKATAPAGIQFCSHPNQYARPAGLEKKGDLILVHGYQEFSLSSSAPVPLPLDPALQQKQRLVSRFFTSEFMKGKSVLDLGANGGFFSIWAQRCGASHVTALDMDLEYTRMIRAVTSLLDTEGIEVTNSRVQDCSEEADIVIAFAMVHWLYSCTAAYGSLNSVVEKLRKLTRRMLIVEWVEPDDPAIAMLQHTSWNSSIIQEPYSREAFENALRRHFPRTEIYGRTNETRTLYIAWAQPHEIELDSKLPLLAPEESILSARWLARCDGRDFYSHVYQDEQTILKQASYDLAFREKKLLDRLQSSSFPRAISAEQHDGYSTVVLERVRGAMLTQSLPAIASTPASLAAFFDGCLALLKELQQAGIVHRDIRADNLMVRDGRPVLIDFGWAIANDNPYCTPPGLGDMGRPADGSFCDVYSMGKVFALVSPTNSIVFQPLIEAMTQQDRSRRTVCIEDLQALLRSLPLPAGWKQPPHFGFVTRDFAPLEKPAAPVRKAAARALPFRDLPADQLRAKAEELCNESRWAEAAEMFEEMCRRDADDLSAWRGRIQCARSQGYDVIADLLQEDALEAHPEWAAALNEVVATPAAPKVSAVRSSAPSRTSTTSTPSGTPRQVSERMKRDWNERAMENARYYVRSTSRDQTEEEFDASGAENVESLVIAELPRLVGGRSAKELTMLEIGCGVGRMSRHFAQHFKSVHAIDVSGEMIRQARQRLGNVPNLKFYETSGADLELFKDGMFDFVFSFIVFQHIPDRGVVLNYIRESHRVLKPGGVFKFQVQGCTDKAWLEAAKDTWFGVTITEDDVARLSEELGFDLIARAGQGTQYSWYTLRKTSVRRAGLVPGAQILEPASL